MKTLKAILFLLALACAAEVALAGEPDWDDAFRDSKRANQEAWELLQMAQQLPGDFPQRQNVISFMAGYRAKALTSFQQLEAVDLGSLQPSEQLRQSILDSLNVVREYEWPAIREFLKDVEDEFDGQIKSSARQLRFKAWRVKNKMGDVVHELD